MAKLLKAQREVCSGVVRTDFYEYDDASGFKRWLCGYVNDYDRYMECSGLARELYELYWDVRIDMRAAFRHRHEFGKRICELLVRKKLENGWEMVEEVVRDG